MRPSLIQQHLFDANTYHGDHDGNLAGSQLGNHYGNPARELLREPGGEPIS